MRLRDAKRDLYRRMAKHEGYRSRSAYKLIQLDNKYHLLKAGFVVIDFGAAPGGWMQVSTKKVGERGLVIAVDLTPVKPIDENTVILTADVLAPETRDRLLEILPREADLILSDLAPSVTGIWQMDHLRQIDLSSRVVDLMPSLLRRGGSAILKVFEGEETNQLTRKVKGSFNKVSIAKPPASRGQSSEIYLVALDFRAD
jgi:23S rRNA (uridine2552-2'-O)-methyltransferase